ncbi:MAG: PSP1 domain-containing protein [Propionicimonas sp.]
MPRVIAVAFQPLGRLYYFDAGNLELSFGQAVLVPTGDGDELAHCVWGPAELDWMGELPLCLGRAAAGDERRDDANRVRRAEIAGVARTLIARHELAMRVVGVDFIDQSLDFDQQAVIYYEAPGRVDFRALLVDLARSLQARIDLRQIGSRDAAAIIGGCGACGLELCCSVMGPPTAVTIRMARTQGLANPSQFLGACGRLMCCLAYEEKLYADYNAQAPVVGALVGTPHGAGTVVSHSVPLDAVVVQVATERFTCRLGRLCAPGSVPKA